ncbi:MAG: 2,4'-dihydroxyacetophenone dioxygenase family protein [Gammaproteobacteria bacterium]
MTDLNIPEVMRDGADLEWVPVVAGIDLKRLFTSPETGRWTVLFRCQPGSFIPRHKHLGAGEYFMLKGRMDYRMGTALAGVYGYEPIGSVHDMTSFPEYTELLFTNFGPVLFLNADDSIASVLDYELVDKLATAA